MPGDLISLTVGITRATIELKILNKHGKDLILELKYSASLRVYCMSAHSM